MLHKSELHQGRADILKERSTPGVILALIVLIVLPACAHSPDSPRQSQHLVEAGKNLTFAFSDSVEGYGYFMSYRYERMRNQLALIDDDETNGVDGEATMHGSGFIDSSSKIIAYSNLSIKGNYSKKIWDGRYHLEEEYGSSGIVLIENSSLSFRPAALSIGAGYYANNPVNLSLPLSRSNWIKNRATGISMTNSADHATSLIGDYYFMARDIQSTSDLVNHLNASISEKVIDGMSSIEAFKADPLVVDYELLASRPVLEFDEAYAGNFSINKRMDIGNYDDVFNLTFYVDDDVEGSGYYMRYKSTKLQDDSGIEGNDIVNKQFTRGTGDLKLSMQLGDFRIRNNTTNDEDRLYLAIVTLAENAFAVYRPSSLGLQEGYYAASPIALRKRISDEASIKNRPNGVSMAHGVLGAKMLRKDNQFEAFSSWSYPDYTTMNITEDVIDGRIRTRVLAGAMHPDTYNVLLMPDLNHSSMWRAPLEVDEDYRGNISIKSGINITSDYTLEGDEFYDDWLPCCEGGPGGKNATMRAGEDASDDELPCCSYGYYSLGSNYRSLLGESMEGMFNCSCFMIPGDAAG
jgi:hypothetical protein